MNNSDLAYTALFDLEADPIVCEIEDTTNYASPPSGTAAVDPDKATVYYKVTTPTGVILNSFPTSADVGSPDIFPVLGDDTTQVTLPLNVSDRPTSGNYTFQTMLRVWANSAAAINIEGASASAKTITITGNVAAAITALIGGYFTVQGSTNNDGVFTVVSATFDGIASTVIVVSETVVDDAIGVGTFTYFDSYTDYTSTALTQYFNLTDPTASIESSFSCRTAELTLTDLSGYTGTNNGVSYSPYAQTRELTAIAPVNPDGSGFSPTTSTTALVSMTLSGIYTGNWRLGLYTSITYQLSSCFSVNTFIQAAQDLEVECDECACTYFQCVDNLWDKYYAYLTSDTARAATVRSILVEIEHSWMLYQMASQCGYDTTAYCNKISELAAADDCVCSGSTSGLSTLVVAWAAGSGSSTSVGSSWYNDSGVPLNTLGVNNDYYLDDDTANYYKKITGAWVLQGNLKASAPAWHNGIIDPVGTDGSVGDYWLNTVTKQYFTKTGVATWTSLGYLISLTKVHSDITSSASIASAAAQTLKTYTLPAGTLLNLGDEVVVECFFAIKTTLAGNTLSIQVNMDTGNLFNRSWVSPGNPNTIRTFSRYSVSTTNVISGNNMYADLDLSPSEIYESVLAGNALNLTLAHDITVDVTSSAGAAGDVTCQAFQVYILKK